MISPSTIRRWHQRRTIGSEHPHYVQPDWQLSWQHPDALPALTEQTPVFGDPQVSAKDRRQWGRLAVVGVLDRELMEMSGRPGIRPAVAYLLGKPADGDDQYKYNGKLFVGELRSEDVGVMHLPDGTEAPAHALRIGPYAVRVALGVLVNGRLALPESEAMTVHATSLNSDNPQPLTIDTAFQPGSAFAKVNFS